MLARQNYESRRKSSIRSGKNCKTEEKLDRQIVETEEKCLHGKTAKAEVRARAAKIAKLGKKLERQTCGN